MNNYSETFTEAVEQLNRSLSAQKLQIGVYGKTLTDVVVRSYFVEPLDTSGDENLWSTLNLNVEYSYPVLSDRGTMVVQDEGKVFTLLCPAFDNKIPDRMLGKLWGKLISGVMVIDKPDTIAVEAETGVIYLVYLRGDRLILTSVGELPKYQVDLIPWVNQAYPFYFYIEPEVLYDLITGEVGWKEVREHMSIKFMTEVSFSLEINITKELEL